MGAHLLAMTYLNKYANDFQKHKFLEPSVAGSLIGSLGVTEPFEEVTWQP